MQRIQSVITQTLTQIKQKLQLTDKQVEKLAKLKTILLKLESKTKQEIYEGCIEEVKAEIRMSEHEYEILFDILYETYFKHFVLLKQCLSTVEARQSKSEVQVQRINSDLLFLNVEKPYCAVPLSEAVELTISRGVHLDPQYLD